MIQEVNEFNFLKSSIKELGVTVDLLRCLIDECRQFTAITLD